MSARTLFVFVAAWCALVLTTSGRVHAQESAPGGADESMVGTAPIEIALDGAQQAPRGGWLRWSVVVYRVDRTTGLVPAARARVRLLSSLVRDRALQDLTADAQGRVALELRVPDDAPETFNVAFEVDIGSGRHRQFELEVRALASWRMNIALDRTRVMPGGVARLFGRLLSSVDGAPIRGVDVNLSATGGRATSPLVGRTMRTDAGGNFDTTLQIPASAIGNYALQLSAANEHDAVSGSATVEIVPAPSEPMIVRVAPSRAIVRPRERIDVQVVVRTSEGRPVSLAQVESSRIPRVRGGRPVTIRTDDRGRATFSFEAPASESGAQDLPIDVQVDRVGLGTARGRGQVRVASHALFAGVSVEGGALVASVPNRVYVRVTGADGMPAPAGVRVSMRSPWLSATVGANTDASGVAAIEIPPGAQASSRSRTGGAAPQSAGASAGADPDDTADDRANAHDSRGCGGESATGFDIDLEHDRDRGAVHGCLRVDPDAFIRARPSDAWVAPAGTLRVALHRAPSVASLPTEIALLERSGESLSLVRTTVVARDAREADIAVPPGVHGIVLIRVRPLWGALQQPLRGTFAAVLVAPRAGPNAQLVVHDATASLAALTGVGGPNSEATYGRVFALPLELADAFVARLRANVTHAHLVDLDAEYASWTPSRLAGTLASLLPVDAGAPFVLRSGRVHDVPATESPARLAILRDPWRTRSRFVEGRLARIFREIERAVSESGPSQLADVAARDAAGRWTFNRSLLDALSRHGELAHVSVRALGGVPLTIDALARLDPAFTFDNLARRITRRRLFVTLASLRRYARDHGLDVGWAWRGDPTTWLSRLTSEGIMFDNSNSIQPRDILDGWGTPLALRPATGGRTRFSFLVPVPGHELVSAGPDQRFGTTDDIRDPFARVLPSGGAYARAVDEDGLMSRIGRVEVGRASFSALSELLEIDADVSSASADDATLRGTSSWSEVPGALVAPIASASTIRATQAAPAFASQVSALGPRAAPPSVTIALDGERRDYAVVALAWASNGASSLSVRPVVAGGELAVQLPLTRDASGRTVPMRAVAGEPLRVRAHVINLADHAAQVTLRSTAAGPIRVEAPAVVAVPEGASVPVDFVVLGQSQGHASLSLMASAGASRANVGLDFDVDRGGQLLRADPSAWLRPTDARVELRAPVERADRVTSARLVILAPSRMIDDPEFDRIRRLDPAVVAWAHSVAGRALPTDLRSALDAAQRADGEVPGLPYTDDSTDTTPRIGSSLVSTACALATWSAAEPEDVAARNAAARARNRLSSWARRPGTGEGLFAGTDELSSSLLALAPGYTEGDGADDFASTFVQRARSLLRERAGETQGDASVLARAAAALLLLDPDDAVAAEAYRRARRSVRDDQFGRAWVEVRHDGRDDPVERLVATAALALAAHQRNDRALADRLARSAASRLAFAVRHGGATAFWLVAAAAYGVFGSELAQNVTVSTRNGPPRAVQLHDGVATIDLPLGAPEASAGVVLSWPQGSRNTDAALFARAAWLFERDAPSGATGSIVMRIEGDPGFADESAALELVITDATDVAMDRVAVEVQLPAAAWLDDEARRALTSRADVRAVEPRPGGVVRIVLSTLRARGTARLPLAFRWRGHGLLRGLGAQAYEESSPHVRSVLPDRVIDLRPRPAE